MPKYVIATPLDSNWFRYVIKDRGHAPTLFKQEIVNNCFQESLVKSDNPLYLRAHVRAILNKQGTERDETDFDFSIWSFYVGYAETKWMAQIV